MLELELKDGKVYYKGVQVKINAQASKGEFQEVIDISNYSEANGKKWLSLNKFRDAITKEWLPNGIYSFECVAKVVTKKDKVILTEEEQERVNELQAQIDAIYEEAKKRTPIKPDLDIDIDSLSLEEQIAYAKQLQKFLGRKQ